MSEKNLGIIGGGQLGSMLAVAAKKLKIKTIIPTKLNFLRLKMIPKTINPITNINGLKIKGNILCR